MMNECRPSRARIGSPICGEFAAAGPVYLLECGCVGRGSPL